MRIFMLVQHPTARGPVPKHTSHLVAELRSLGCTVVTHTWGQRQHGESLLHKLTKRALDVLSVRRALKRDRQFDVAVVKTAHDWRTLLRDIAVVLVIRRRCRPIVLQLHGSHSSELVEPGGQAFKAATALLLTLVDAVLVLSTEEQRQWQAFRQRPQVFTVKNPYVSLFSSEGSDRTNSSVSGVRALFVGRLMREKGIFELVEAFADVLQRMECKLVIVGEGGDAEASELRDRIRSLGLENHVTMPGYLSGPELRNVYRESSIFVLPSWSEGFPTVLAEAMDAGLPIVTTYIRGAADHLISGENALFVDPRDAKGLASAIITLLTDRDLRTRMASANRRRIEIFHPELVAAEYLEVLKSVSVMRGMNSETLTMT
jgi:glycosyltransferase involved in cell wall biosynthesis